MNAHNGEKILFEHVNGYRVNRGFGVLPFRPVMNAVDVVRPGWISPRIFSSGIEFRLFPFSSFAVVCFYLLFYAFLCRVWNSPFLLLSLARFNYSFILFPSLFFHVRSSSVCVFFILCTLQCLLTVLYLFRLSFHEFRVSFSAVSHPCFQSCHLVPPYSVLLNSFTRLIK